MELSQPRPSGARGGKPTHDFLSLYSQAHQDPAPAIPAPGSYLKTHDFLQPLDQTGKNICEEVEYSKRSFPPSPPTTVEHVLPGGMGTYSINHISYINQTQKVSKPEGIVISAAQSSSSNNNDENSNCSSYTGSGFTLWEESDVNKGKTRKEKYIAGTNHTVKDGRMKIGVPWMTSQSSSICNHQSTLFSSFSSSHPSSAPKNPYFVDMKSGKSIQELEDIGEEFVIKKEPSFHHKSPSDQRPNSPRSKHSATEQRRRSKINDRFSMLRGIIPHADLKRDKASFLLEVIEYIQYLQEKVHKYEDSSQRWTNEPPKTIPINNFIHQPQLQMRQNLLDSNTISLDATMETSQHPQSTNKPSCSAAAYYGRISAPDTETAASHAQPQLSHSRSCKTDCTITNDKLKDQELIIESGTISISTIYSQGLSTALTQALNSSGVDLSHANISVQIDLGKRSNTNTLDSSPPHLKENLGPSIHQSTARSRIASTWEEESGEGFKRLKTSRK